MILPIRAFTEYYKIKEKDVIIHSFNDYEDDKILRQLFWSFPFLYFRRLCPPPIGQWGCGCNERRRRRWRADQSLDGRGAKSLPSA
mmetsp:Transcript_19309/g.38753  ORF Transcript_19309/g.38753 Transcript_19309/m.38753 type:complete len:86 (+) Transcript_19309:110-367(+)